MKQLKDILNDYRSASEREKTIRCAVVDKSREWGGTLSSIDYDAMKVYKTLGCIDRNHYSAYCKLRTLRKNLNKVSKHHSVVKEYDPEKLKHPRARKYGRVTGLVGSYSLAIPIVAVDAVSNIILIKLQFGLISEESRNLRGVCIDHHDLLAPSYRPLRDWIKRQHNTKDMPNGIIAYSKIEKQAEQLVPVLENICKRIRAVVDPRKAAKARNKYGLNGLTIYSNKAKHDAQKALKVVNEINALYKGDVK